MDLLVLWVNWCPSKSARMQTLMWKDFMTTGVRATGQLSLRVVTPEVLGTMMIGKDFRWEAPVAYCSDVLVNPAASWSMIV